MPAAPTLRAEPANAAHEIGAQSRQEVGRLARGVLDLREHILPLRRSSRTRPRRLSATSPCGQSPSAALVGLPSASRRAMAAAGPRGARGGALARSAGDIDHERGKTSGLEIRRPRREPDGPRRERFRRPRRECCLTALFSGAEGISSVPISNRIILASAMAYATLAFPWRASR